MAAVTAGCALCFWCTMTTPLPWIKVYGDLPTHRKSVTLAALLNEPRAWTHVVELWLWVSRHAPEGDLGKMPDAAVAHVAGWRGDAGSFVNALRVAGFLDETRIHGWYEHNGAHFRKQAADKVRNARPVTEPAVKENPLTSESLVSHKNNGSVESIEYREEKEPEKNLALFENRKGAAPHIGPGLAAWLPTPEAAAEWDSAVKASYRKAHGIPDPPTSDGESRQPDEKPRRGRPPKDRSPEAEAERLAEKADGDRWMDAARKLTGLTADELRWSTGAWMAFRKQRKARGIDQLMRALEGLESDTFSKTAGLGWLVSDNGITKGLATAARRANVVGIGFDETWDRYAKEAGLVGQ